MIEFARILDRFPYFLAIDLNTFNVTFPTTRTTLFPSLCRSNDYFWRQWICVLSHCCPTTAFTDGWKTHYISHKLEPTNKAFSIVCACFCSLSMADKTQTWNVNASIEETLLNTASFEFIGFHFYFISYLFNSASF